MQRRAFIAATLGVMGVRPETSRPHADLRLAAIRAVHHMDNIATSDCSMGWEDIDDLCKAREGLVAALGLSYDEETSRHTPAEGEE